MLLVYRSNFFITTSGMDMICWFYFDFSCKPTNPMTHLRLEAWSKQWITPCEVVFLYVIKIKNKSHK